MTQAQGAWMVLGRVGSLTISLCGITSLMWGVSAFFFPYTGSLLDCVASTCSLALLFVAPSRMVPIGSPRVTSVERFWSHVAFRSGPGAPLSAGHVRPRLSAACITPSQISWEGTYSRHRIITQKSGMRRRICSISLYCKGTCLQRSAWRFAPACSATDGRCLGLVAYEARSSPLSNWCGTPQGLRLWALAFGGWSMSSITWAAWPAASYLKTIAGRTLPRAAMSPLSATVSAW